jgi:hypothetical protein
VYNKFVVCSSLLFGLVDGCMKPVTSPVVIDRYSCLYMYVSGLVRVTIEEFSGVFRAEGFVYRWDCCCFSWANAGNVVYIVSGRTVYTGYESLQWAHRTV